MLLYSSSEIAFPFSTKVEEYLFSAGMRKCLVFGSISEFVAVRTLENPEEELQTESFTEYLYFSGIK